MCPLPFEPMSIERARYIVAHPAEFSARAHTLFPAAWRVLRGPHPVPVPVQPGDAA